MGNIYSFTISTLLFFALPSSVSFEETGERGPTPNADKMVNQTPFWRWVFEKFELILLTGTNFIFARSVLFFFLIIFILCDSIISKIVNINITITYYQIIENMARENNIGENVKKYRTKQGLSQEDFAKKSGFKYTMLTKIERGVIKKSSVLVMAKITKALGVNIEGLIK